MAIVKQYFQTGYGIDNPNTSVKWQWTGKDYVPYFNWNDLGSWYYDGSDSLRVINQTTSYDLSDFNIGHEVSFCLGYVLNNGTSTEYDVEYGVKIYRKLTTGSETLQFTYLFTGDIPSDTAVAFYAGTGVDYDEEWDNIEYTRYSMIINGVEVDSITVTYTNLQSFSNSLVGETKKGYIWVDSNSILFNDGAYDGNRYAKHVIRNDGTIYSTGKTPGYIRIDEINHGKLCYIDDNGNERKTYQAKNYWLFSQLTTGKTPGYIWVSGGWDTYSYLNFIGYDGKHYCIMNGEAVGYEGNNLP